MVTAGLVSALFLPAFFSVPATIIVVFLTAVLIICLRPGTLGYAVFAQRHMVFIGLISYSLYLWHWGVLWLSRTTVGIYWWTAPFQIALIFFLATATYCLVENPLRRSTWSTRPILTVGYGAIAAVFIASTLFVVDTRLQDRLFLGPILGVAVPENLVRTWWEDKRTGEWLEKCQVKYKFSPSLISDCLKVPPAAKGTVYVVGDSHARNYLPAIKASFPGYAFAYLTMGYGCAFLPPSMSSEYSNVACSDYVRETTDFLSIAVHNGDIVFVGQRLHLKSNDDRQTPLYVDFIASLARILSSKNVPVVLLDGTAPPDVPPEQCTALPWRPFGPPKGCSISIADAEAMFQKFDMLAKKKSNEVPNLFYVPLRLGLCRQDGCGQLTSADITIWHDVGHITEDAAIELSPLLRRKLAEQQFYVLYQGVGISQAAKTLH
jgi:hypothetical protein